jgi:hypothetical protein
MSEVTQILEAIATLERIWFFARAWLFREIERQRNTSD